MDSATVTEATILNTIATLRNNNNMKKAQVWTYTYKPLVGMSFEVDPRGIKTEYTYDGFQRLKDILDFENNILSNYQYNYVNQPSIFSSVLKSRLFTRNNCTSGQTGSSVTYTVPAGRYTSTISQADADQKAINDVNTNGQTYANTNGGCSYVGNSTIILQKETNWEGIIGRITFFNSNNTIVEIFPTNSGPEESFQIPSGQYTRIRFDIEPSGASYDGYLNIFSANVNVGCQNIGMNNIELNFYNIFFSASGNNILIHEGCL